MKKTISIMVPTFNEEENVELMYEALKDMFQKKLHNYQYEILFIDNIDKVEEARNLKTIEENDYFTFQNLIRQAIGEEPVEPPNPNENPRVALIKAKGRYREKIKKKKGNKSSIPFNKTLVALCCMNLGLNPLNIGEIPYPAVSPLFSMAQDKEKYETDLKIATAGFGNKKVKPKYWIQNKD